MSTESSDPRPADPSVRLERDERGIATLVVDAPPVNLYTLDLHARIDACLDEVEASPPRVLVVRAAGRIVSGGVDVAEFHARTSREQTQELYDRMMRLPERVAALEMPTVFAAHALTLTWAFEVALACDLIVAAEEARFGLVERVIGLTPTMGGTQRLAQRAGVARAKELVFTGALFEAAVLERWNVVNRVLPRAELDAGLDALVADLAVGPTRAFATAKQILRELEADGLAHANARTTTLASALFETDDLRHGMASFLEHGPGHARFEGR